MDQRRVLFKSNPYLSRDKAIDLKTSNDMRSKHRHELFSLTRNISPSPSPNRQSEQKENVQPSPKQKLNVNTVTPLSQNTNKKTLRKKEYLMKYLAWKANKEGEQAKKEQSKNPAFVVPLSSGPSNGTRNMTKSFAPTNHLFKPPEKLEDPRIDILGKNKFHCVIGNQSIVYNFVPTPKKTKPVQSKVSVGLKTSMPINKKPLYLRIDKKPESSLKPQPIASKRISPNAVQSRVSQPSNVQPKQRLNAKPPFPPKTPIPAKAPIPAKIPIPAKKPIQAKPPIEAKKNHVPDLLNKARVKPPPLQIPAKPPVKSENNIASKLKMPPPSQYLRKDTVKSTTSKESSKSGLPPLKRPNFKASKKAGTSIKNAFSVVNGKVKKIKTIDTKGEYLQLTAKAEIASETPADPNSFNTVFGFVTSTKRKSEKDSKIDNLFVFEEDILSPVDSSARSRPDFIRYSIVQTDTESTPKQAESKTKKSSSDASAKEEGITLIKDPVGSTLPSVYMGPYVSVSRGKVSTKIEREKRNSVYVVTDSSAAPKTVVAEHHTMATVRYYQKQLKEEVDRLNKQCRVWKEYKEANPQLGDVGGLDMIDATIGQTQLLINKKLKQFGGLIDRCEQGCDEGFKPVLPEDLDGFWSMVGLQIENVDKRFANVERWKANNWTDPDEVPVQKAKVKKMKSKPAASARPNQALQKMLKAAHAAYLKKKAIGDTDDDVILTPSRRQVVIKNRRSKSAAATVITVNSTKIERISSEKRQMDLNETPKLSPHINGFRKSINLLKNTLLGEQDRRSPMDDPTRSCLNSQQSSNTKSILKTPGSVRKSKSVIFNSKALKFTIEDTINDEFKSDQERDTEEEQRTYKLRNRKIVLRDSADFVIPK